MRALICFLILPLFSFAQDPYNLETVGAGEAPVQQGAQGQQVCPNSPGTGDDEYFASLARSADPQFDQRRQQQPERGRQ